MIITETIKINITNKNGNYYINKGYDSTKTEVEIMHDRGYYSVFHLGGYLFIYKTKTE